MLFGLVIILSLDYWWSKLEVFGDVEVKEEERMENISFVVNYWGKVLVEEDDWW